MAGSPLCLMMVLLFPYTVMAINMEMGNSNTSLFPNASPGFVSVLPVDAGFNGNGSVNDSVPVMEESGPEEEIAPPWENASVEETNLFPEEPLEQVDSQEDSASEGKDNFEQASPDQVVVPPSSPSISIKDRAGAEIGNYTLIAEENGGYTIDLFTHRQSVGIASSEAVRVHLEGVFEVEPVGINAMVDELVDSDTLGDVPYSITTPVIFIENVTLRKATITLPKRGSVGAVLGCSHFDSQKFECGKWAKLEIPFMDRGDTIEFTVSHFSAYAGGEIIAIDAGHYDEFGMYLSNIYDAVKTRDQQWSEPVYQNQIVRVTFEENLTDGRTIDFVARSNGTFAYVEVYEAGTNHVVGRSGTIDRAELEYIQVRNLTEPGDTFDFKVQKTNPDPDDDSTDIDESVHSFLEFDFIHDEAFNTTTATGIIVYEQANTATPRYRFWNDSSYNYTPELVDMNSVGVDGTSDITWNVVRANHQRDEIIVGTEDKTNDINIQILNSTKNWGNLLAVSTNVPNSAFRAFDIAVEDISGDVLIVYENSSLADSVVSYRLWNGTDYSEQQYLTTGLGSSVINWAALTPSLGTDDIMLLLHNDLNSLHAIRWNGTGFETTTNLTLSTATVSNTDQHFAFAWEEANGAGLAVYGEGNNFVYREYNFTTSPYWSGGTAIDLAHGLNAIRLCSEPTSDYIGLVWQDTGVDLQVRIWNGSVLEASPPTQDGLTEAHGTNNINLDCAWLNSSTALFGFIDDASLTIDYFNFTKPNTWSVTALTAAPTTVTVGADDIEGLRFTKHPSTDQIMVITQDILEDVRAARWNGTGFTGIGESPLETVTEVLNSAQESAQFDWYRYDPVPAVTNVNPSGLSFTASTTIDINATVTDNILVDSVFVNLTYPNGSIQSLRLVNRTGNSTHYNLSFSGTTNAGTYTVRIIANDSSMHQNQNRTETATFTITAAPDTVLPNITDLRPVNGSRFNMSDPIEIAANVTDNTGVSQVFGNISYSNGSIELLSLALATGNKYNLSFTIPRIQGNYNITFVANDTSNNRNNTQITFFSVGDTLLPNVTDVRPVNGSRFNMSDPIEIAANATDNGNISLVLANISYPNGSIELLTLSPAQFPKYNLSFTIPRIQGNYNITFIANDTNNNRNTTQITFFTVGDTIVPNVSSVRPVNGSRFNVSDTIEIAANATDNGNISLVFANISYPNGSIELLSLSLAVFPKYNLSFTIPGIQGNYNITFVANDTSNNYNRTQITFFSIGDTLVPNVTNVRPVNGSRFNVSDTIEIAANATDNGNISLVFANISYPNGSMELLSLSLAVFPRYNLSFTIPRIQGNYNITFIANDTSNNYNRTQIIFFTIGDTIIPNVTNVRPINGSRFNTSDTVEIAANATDNGNISLVFANISYPNGSMELLTLSPTQFPKYNLSFTIPRIQGNYNITFIANDTNNNRNVTQIIFFTIGDTRLPAVFALVPAAGTPFTVLQTIEIAANVTENGNISVITANITFPNGTQERVTLTAALGDKYNGTFNIPNAAGQYNVTYFANDTNNNVNNTQTTFFNTNPDSTAPTITDVRPINNSRFNTSDALEIAANVSDNIQVAQVFGNISYPNGTTELLELTLAAGTKYNRSFTIPRIQGNYNITFVANDTTNNQNGTLQTFFTVGDTMVPAVFALIPANGSTVSVNSTLEIAANVTENGNVSVVFVNISYSNGTQERVTLANTLGDKYNASVPFHLLGSHNITFFANDTNNNRNATQITFITVSDTTLPAVRDIRPTNGSRFNTSDVMEIAVNVTDNAGVSQVLGNVSYPNGSIELMSLTLATGSKYNRSFTIPRVQGNYNITFIANDTNNNRNTTQITFFAVGDTLVPAVFALLPANGSSFNVSNTIEIAANVTENGNVSIVTANVSFPNGTQERVTLIQALGDKYNTTFTIPQAIGSYNVTYFANDTNNNINNTQTVFFTALDQNNLTLTILGCIPADANLSQTIRCNLTATDNVGISTVSANVTLPNGTNLSQTITNFSSNYTFTFSGTTLAGQYTVLWNANDTSNNRRNATDLFNVSDRVAPTITLNAPTNDTNSSSTTQNFNITATDNYNTTFNCTLFINSTLNQTNATTNSGANTLFAVNGFLEQNYLWNVTCTDGSNNTNTSETRFFKIDITPPTFISLTTSPNSEADLDPGISVLALANVSDNRTSVQTVILQRKLSTASSYTNATMTFNTTSQLYSVAFNASDAGTYNLRLYANDSVGNAEISNEVNISVQLDRNWTRSPSLFTPVSATVNQNITLGNLTINNSGDVELNFTLTSDSNTTVFNETVNFTLTAGTYRIVRINDSAQSTGTKTVTITINASPDATPSLLNSTGTIVAVAGQPILTATFTTPSSETLSVTQGDTNVPFTATLENVGTGNASNVTFFLTIPDDWTLTFGVLNITLDVLGAGESTENSIEVTIPTTASTGTKYVIANATGFNSSNESLNSAGLVFADRVTVSVNVPAAILGPRGGGVAATTAAAAAGVSLGGGGGGIGGVGRITDEEMIYTMEEVSIVRGSSQQFPVHVTNVFQNATITDITMGLKGFLSRYILVRPYSIEVIRTLETKEFWLTLIIPTYFLESEYELYAQLSYTLVPVNPELAGYTQKKVVEYRTIRLHIEEVSQVDLSKQELQAEECVAAMENASFPTARLQGVLDQARDQIQLRNTSRAKELLGQVCDIKEEAFQAYDLMSQAKARIALAQQRGLETPEAEEELALAYVAFEREDFELAAARAKDAQLAAVVEVKHAFNIIAFVSARLFSVSAGVIALTVLGLLFFRRMQLLLLQQRFVNLGREENAILGLIATVQRDYIVRKVISKQEYTRYVEQYRKRLVRIKELRVQNRKQFALHKGMLSPGQAAGGEKRGIQALLQKSQERFLVQGKGSARALREEELLHHRRLGEMGVESRGRAWRLNFYLKAGRQEIARVIARIVRQKMARRKRGAL